MEGILDQKLCTREAVGSSGITFSHTQNEIAWAMTLDSCHYFEDLHEPNLIMVVGGMQVLVAP